MQSGKEFAELLEQGSVHFWQMAETRPFIRAKHGLAHSLSLDGQANEAIAEMQDILRLNPNDNMGVRQAIIPLLLKQNREREAIQVLESYPEQSASWLYMKAQVEFRKGGPGSRDAAKALKAAIKFNPHVAELLRDDGPPRMPDQYTLGSIEEAAIVIEEQADSWSEIDGFEEWMVAGFQNYVREEMKHQRELQIKRKLIDQARKKSKKRR